MKALRRAAAGFRLGPRSYLAGLGARQRPGPEELADVERLAAFYGPAHAAAPAAGHVLLLSYQSLPYSLKLEGLLARAMQERGWKVSVVATPGTEPFARAYHGRLLGCEVHCLEDFVSLGPERSVAEQVAGACAVARSSLADFKALVHHGAPLALHALATLSAMRPDGMVQADEASVDRLGRLLRRSLLLFDAAGRLYDKIRPTLALGIEKGFVGTCETFHAALRRETDYVQWVGCHEPDSIMLKRYRRDNYRDHPFSISDRNWQRLRSVPWRDAYAEEVMREFERGYRSGNWFRYKSIASATEFPERDVLQRRLGLDPQRRTAIIYSHILSDANLFYGNDLFRGGYEQWLVETVRAAAENQNVNWVLKIHPANVQRNRRLGYAGEYGELVALRNAFGSVPSFLKVVRPEEEVSPFAFFGITDWGVTVRGTVGLELPCFGIPVLTAGTGRYSGKGFTEDSASTSEYVAKLRSIERIPRLAEERVRLGMLYAYHVFRTRPARYGAVCRDTYAGDPKDRTYRNVELLAPSAPALFGHPQIGAMADFLASEDDEFLDPAALRSSEDAAIR